MARQFDIRKSPVDGKLRLWEQRSALDLGIVTQDEIDARAAIDGLIWVVVGVHKGRRAIFGARK